MQEQIFEVLVKYLKRQSVIDYYKSYIDTKCGDLYFDPPQRKKLMKLFANIRATFNKKDAKHQEKVSMEKKTALFSKRTMEKYEVLKTGVDVLKTELQ